MGNTNKKWESMSEKAIITHIGQFIKKNRLKQNKTQTKLAKTAGVNRWTISQAENGEAISLTSLIQLLRALDLLSVLNSFETETSISPLALAKLDQQKRQRARTKDTDQQNTTEW